jgi:CarD family transcriptional regulator
MKTSVAPTASPRAQKAVAEGPAKPAMAAKQEAVPPQKARPVAAAEKRQTTAKPAAAKAAIDKSPPAAPATPQPEPAKPVTSTKTLPVSPPQTVSPQPASFVAEAPAPVVKAMPAEPARVAETPAPLPARPGLPAMANGRPVPPSRAAAKEENFVEGDFVVYPTHGVGKVEKINVEEIAGHKLELIRITFEENRMTLRVPVPKARSAGLRKLATRKMFDEALAVLKGRARIKRTMWSRRAQEYEAKINSGDPIAIAEVVRDLHRNAGQPDQSFSERQIYEQAMDRLAAELGALDMTDKATAVTKLASYLKTA